MQQLTSPINVLDIGAWPEGQPRWAPLPHKEVQGIEPIKGSEKDLPIFLGNGKMWTFHHCRYQGCSSLFEPDPEIINRFSGIDAISPLGNFTVVRKERVQTVKLDHLKLPTPHLAKLDIQGAELMALQHGWETLQNACVIEVEVEFLPLYKKQPLAHQVMAFFHKKGWILHRLANLDGCCWRPFVVQGEARAVVSQVLFADAVFINPKRLGLEAATILHHCYKSYDLVMQILLGHGLHEVYLKGLQAQPTIERRFP